LGADGHKTIRPSNVKGKLQAESSDVICPSVTRFDFSIISS